MNRREFLAGSISLVGCLSARLAFGQPNGSKRAAVVIGVNKVGDLAPLKAAVSGATAVAAWLEAEGFEVKLFVDDPNPVKASDLVAAIKGFVDRDTLDQLVVYFGGHGFVSGTLSEYWLLSGAPDDVNEAVSLYESRMLARQWSGIPNVVLISDACRTRPDSIRVAQIRGTVVFPNRRATNVTTEVDVFLATRVGDPAYEVSNPQSPSVAEGIFTACLLDAFKRPYPTIVQDVGGKLVIPNRRLKTYLEQEVPKRAQAVSIQYDQNPDLEVNSGEARYIARVVGSNRLDAGTPTPTLAEVAKSAWAGGDASAAPPFTTAELGAVATASGFDRARDTIVQARGLVSQLSARSGFTIAGERLKSVAAKPGVTTKFTNSPDSEPASARVEVDVANKHGASVALRFRDGSGTILAALDEYIGNVVVDAGRVSNVSYVPSDQSWKRAYYQSERQRFEQMHAAIAASARLGVFRIEGPRQTRNQVAKQLADRIRMLKGYDPTLGLYAAYAYADAGLSEKVNSVQHHMREDLGSDLFDVALLAGKLSGKSPGGPNGPIPWCPMLSQGWELLRISDVRLPQNVEAVRDHLRPSLWLTLDSAGMQIAESAMQSGQVG